MKKNVGLYSNSELVKTECFSYETTAAALLFTSFLLATNPKVQEKLQAEIDSKFPSLETRASYDSVTELPYLEQVLCESMRVYPPIPSHIGRWAAQERTICGKEGNHYPSHDVLVRLSPEGLGEG